MDFSTFNKLDKKLINQASNLMDGFNMAMTKNEVEVQSMFLLSTNCILIFTLFLFFHTF